MLILEPVAVPRVVGAVWEHRAKSGVRMPFAQSETVLRALRSVSRLLDEHGIRHAVIGGIAVGVYGWERSTRDVDLLLANEAWERQPSGALSPRILLPEVVDDVPIDYLPIDVAGSFLEVAFERPQRIDGLPIAPVEVVVCTKLIRLSMRDQADIVEIVKAQRIERFLVREFLAKHTPMLVGRWDALVTQAEAELSRAKQGSNGDESG